MTRRKLIRTGVTTSAGMIVGRAQSIRGAMA